MNDQNRHPHPFRLLAAALLLVAGVAYVSAPTASAASCTVGPYTGTCKDTCTADEVMGATVQLQFQGKYTASDCGTAVNCCIPKGSSLCSTAATDSGAVDELKTSFGCVPSPCTGTELASKLTYLGETCTGGNICCTAVTGETKTLQETPPPASGGTASPVKLFNPLGEGVTFYSVIRNVINAFLGMVGGLALLVFVYAGVLWMTAGSSDRVQKAKDTMKYAIIGLAMIAFSYVITSFVVDALLGKVGPPVQPIEPEYALPPEPNP
ncbi:pilin [Candidatus Uhrbacteria bacterium]|nr:pilin [Candidatus Uhrbacteria bacterium]